jgi:hypothetical protein
MGRGSRRSIQLGGGLGIVLAYPRVPMAAEQHFGSAEPYTAAAFLLTESFQLPPRCMNPRCIACSYQIHSSRRHLRAAFRETSVLLDNLIETYRIPPGHARSCSSRRSTRPMPRSPVACRCHYALVGHHLLFLQCSVVERANGSKGASSSV